MSTEEYTVVYTYDVGWSHLLNEAEVTWGFYIPYTKDFDSGFSEWDDMAEIVYDIIDNQTNTDFSIRWVAE